ncbi:uncharacterized protein EI90DRAFT_3022700 [Cantharellus anzutake]|uniref:uncharacterized protein n=1 Tax=Cantharellus anzutake TaxID=1750568 RepID=UPI001903490B|nr:uncharacterized protein EI90DRAFT_3022700 [Cantharellus anzutake]KAF8313285.1 hypothetical protein EI90DRAFT_3022700 [Cantharellus anzutake]
MEEVDNKENGQRREEGLDRAGWDTPNDWIVFVLRLVAVTGISRSDLRTLTYITYLSSRFGIPLGEFSAPTELPWNTGNKMILEALPNDILCEIMVHGALETLLSLSLVSHRLHPLAQLFLYKSVSIVGKGAPVLDCRLHQFVRTLILRPDLGRVVRCAQIRWYHVKRSERELPEEVQRDVHLIQQAAQEKGLHSLAIPWFQSASCYACFALLLHLIPNLNTLSIRIPQSPYSSCGPRDLTKWVGNSIPPGLRSVSKIKLFWDAFRIEDITPFISLPNLSTMSLRGFLTSEEFRKGDVPAKQSLNLRSLMLAVEGDPFLLNILQLPRSLEEFVWEGEIEDGALLHRSLAFQCHSLKTLSISIPWSAPQSSTPIGTLSHFQSLRSLTIPCSLFHDPNHGEVDLFSLLPPTLEQLMLDMGCWDGETSLRLVVGRDLEEWKKKQCFHLPVLDDIVWVFNWTVDAGSVEKLAQIGVQVQFPIVHTIQ